MTSSNRNNSGNYNLAQDPNELFDIYQAPKSPTQYNSIITSDWGPSYYPSPKPTGKIKERGQVHKDGDWHRSVPRNPTLELIRLVVHNWSFSK